MAESRSVPFRHLSPEQWQNLAIAAIVPFYAGQVVADLLWGNLFGNLGSDFAAFWSAGQIANRLGYGSVYDLEVLRQVQSAILPPLASTLVDVRTIPVPFLPIFLIPFQLLALLPPWMAFVVWTGLNAAGTALYLNRYIARLGVPPTSKHLLLLCLASVPVFLNIFLGQANLWLMVCVGEFLLALGDRSPVRAGAWLAGLLLKPQLLILIVPALLLQRQLKALLSFSFSAAAIILASWILAGSDAMMALIRLWMGYAGGLPTNDIQLMMNWRMLALQAGSLLGDIPARIILIAATTLTAACALLPWLRRADADQQSLAAISLGIWAATAAVAWHSHIHTAMILIPPLLMFVLRRHNTDDGVLIKWVMIPAVALIARFVLAALVRLAVLPPQAYSWIDSLAAVTILAVNLWLLSLSARESGFFGLRRHPADATASP